MHPHTMGLHHGRIAIDIYDEPWELVSLAMSEAIDVATRGLGVILPKQSTRDTQSQSRG